MFATPVNHQLPQFVCPFPDPRAIETDALSISWTRWRSVYAFPPSVLLQATLLKIREAAGVKVILVAPWRPAASWFPELLELARDRLPLHLSDGQLTQAIPGLRDNPTRTPSVSAFTGGYSNQAVGTPNVTFQSLGGGRTGGTSDKLRTGTVHLLLVPPDRSDGTSHKLRTQRGSLGAGVPLHTLCAVFLSCFMFSCYRSWLLWEVGVTRSGAGLLPPTSPPSDPLLVGTIVLSNHNKYSPIC